MLPFETQNAWAYTSLQAWEVILPAKKEPEQVKNKSY